MNDEIKHLDKKNEKLHQMINKAKNATVVTSILGAVITTVFSIGNILVLAIISFVVTSISTFLIDMTKRIFMLILWRNNKRRNELIINGDGSKEM